MLIGTPTIASPLAILGPRRHRDGIEQYSSTHQRTSAAEQSFTTGEKPTLTVQSTALLFATEGVLN